MKQIKFRTVTIGENHYNAIREAFDKWISKETAYTPSDLKLVRNYDELLTGKCLCGTTVHESSKYCQECGQKLNFQTDNCESERR